MWEQRGPDLHKAAERWRSLRVRQQLLADLLSVLRHPLQCCQLCLVFGAARDAVLYFSSSIIMRYTGGEHNSAALEVSAFAVACLLLLVVAFGILEWPRDEVGFKRFSKLS